LSSNLSRQFKTSLNLSSIAPDPNISGVLEKIPASNDPSYSNLLPYQSCDNIYNIPSLTKKKNVGIGYGKKSDFTRDLTCSPGATKYQLDTQFDKNRKSKKGFTMY
jgi:hypothetical protein